ncbi:MAG: hypothetical protein PWR27_868 [Petroclostridium sp.]|nr:hypothetical protein [Petroclostridium sp.]
MKVGFIGAGKVGTAMGCYFHKKGIQIVGYYSRSFPPAQQAASWTESRVYNDLKLLASETDLIAITTPDDTITVVAMDLSEIPLPWKNKAVCHMSGVYASDILSLLEQKGATVCSLHPMLSFGDPESAVKSLESIPFTLEGKGPKLMDIKELLKRCDNTWTEISTQNKVLYHTAACMVSNYLVTLLDMGIEMLKNAGFTEEEAKKLIEPLIRKTVDNVMNIGTVKALTGPISRGDTGTIEKHIIKLQEYYKPWLEVYKVMGIQTVELARRERRINEISATKIKEILKV